MRTIASQLEEIIDQHLKDLKIFPEAEMNFKPSPSKWSKKEILGHMADSAQNNIRRFIVAQYEENPKIVYKQDNWVAISNYQQYELSDLINLWYLLNKHIVAVLKNLPDEMKQRKCSTEETHTLEWLAEDYIKHLRHHLHQVLDLEPVAYP
ncbi:MAG: DinB family protein [Bacteroidota bacterium]